MAGIYKGMYLMLSTVYPNYNWVPFNFKRAPRNLINDPKFVEIILKEVENKLIIINLEDWYRVSISQLQKLGFNYLLFSKYGTLFETLKKYRPDYNWDETKFIGFQKKKERQKENEI